MVHQVHRTTPDRCLAPNRVLSSLPAFGHHRGFHGVPHGEDGVRKASRSFPQMGGREGELEALMGALVTQPCGVWVVWRVEWCSGDAGIFWSVKRSNLVF